MHTIPEFIVNFLYSSLSYFELFLVILCDGQTSSKDLPLSPVVVPWEGLGWCVPPSPFVTKANFLINPDLMRKSRTC